MSEQTQLIETAKQAGDVLSLSAVSAVLLGWLPVLTAFVSLVWVSMRIYDTYLTIMAKRARRKDNG